MTASRKSSKPAPPRPRHRKAVACGRVPGPLSLGGALTISEVREWGRALEAMLMAGAATVDARTLGTIDTAGLQLLLAAARSAQDRGLKLRMLGCARLLTGAADELGMGAQLNGALELLE